MRQGKFNVFQRTVLLWNDMYPYNAVHVVRIPKTLELSKLRHIINNVLSDLELANLIINRKKNTYRFVGGKFNVAVHVIDENEVTEALVREIERQLNTPWAENDRIQPFRFFVITDRGGFYLGVVYYHLIAGADSIIYLLKRITDNYTDGKSPSPPSKPDLYPGVYHKLLPINVKQFLQWFFLYPEHISRSRKSFRPRYRDVTHNDIGFDLFVIQPESFSALVTATRDWGVTMNDIFLSLLLKSIEPLASKRVSARRRKNISVASIVNIRDDLSLSDPTSFGLFLSSFNVSHAVPEGITLKELSNDIHRQTKKIKKYKLYFRTLMEMWTALFLIRYFFKQRKDKFYAKYNPLWGGVTNINLNKLWPKSNEIISVDYLRAVSTGHATPLVFSFTTVNDIINLGISYRRSVYDDKEVNKIIARFEYLLSHISE